jgi:MinD-like ATPase involved in chromosome partitioning or flagellar assembly
VSAIAVCSGKGSPGATFVSVNLAAALARAGESVLCIDLDLAGGDLAAYLGLDPRRGLHPLLRMNAGTVDTDGLVREAQERAGFAAVAGFSGLLPEGTGKIPGFLLHRATGSDCLVVADLGRIEHEHVDVAVEAALTIVAVRPDFVSVLGAERAIRCLERADVSRERIVLVVSGTERRRPGDVAEVAEALGVPIAAAIPLCRKAARKAMISQTPIAKGTAAKAFASLAKVALERLAAAEPAAATHRVKEAAAV